MLIWQDEKSGLSFYGFLQAVASCKWNSSQSPKKHTNNILELGRLNRLYVVLDITDSMFHLTIYKLQLKHTTYSVYMEHLHARVQLMQLRKYIIHFPRPKFHIYSHNNIVHHVWFWREMVERARIKATSHQPDYFTHRQHNTIQNQDNYQWTGPICTGSKIYLTYYYIMNQVSINFQQDKK